MSYESHSNYVSNRLSLWCPVCGAKESQGCTVVPGIRFDSHNAIVLGTVPRPVITQETQDAPAFRDKVVTRHKYKKDANEPAKKPGWSPNGWVN